MLLKHQLRRCLFFFTPCFKLNQIKAHSCISGRISFGYLNIMINLSCKYSSYRVAYKVCWFGAVLKM